MKTITQNPSKSEWATVAVGDLFTCGDGFIWLKTGTSASMQMFNKATAQYLTVADLALAREMAQALKVFALEERNLVPGDLSGITDAALEAVTGIAAAGVRAQHYRSTPFSGYNHTANGERWEGSFHRHIATAMGTTVIVGKCRCGGGSR